MLMKMQLVVAAAVAAFGCLALPVYAQTAAPAATPADPATKARWEACQPDVKSLCGSVDRSVKGAIKACLEAHAAELSEGCKKARADRAAEQAAEKK